MSVEGERERENGGVSEDGDDGEGYAHDEVFEITS